MPALEMVSDRFALERIAGSGAMGVVYRARDLVTGQPAAVKVLDVSGRGPDPLALEASLLSRLAHPGIVRYLAHGVTDDGAPYIAMEWLEGCDLASRLARGRLSVRESTTLIARASAALAVAHRSGVVHCDIKPSNLFLVGGDVSDLRVLDFGVARLSSVIERTARAGVVGTPGYLAPEQARGDSDLDARADVFSLGCVLFECLTGRPAFIANSSMALLARILLEEPPPIGSLLATLPAHLERLTERMLSKDRSLRPADAAAVSDAIAIGEPTDAEAVASSRAAWLTSQEQRLLSVIAVRPPTSHDAARAHRRAPLDSLQRAVDGHGGRLEPVADGSIVVSLGGKGTATDLAARAAHCALAIRGALPGSAIALATGRGLIGERYTAVTGEVVDRAVDLLRVAETTSPLSAAANPRSTAGTVIRLDDVTSGLLDARFDVRADADGLVLYARRERSGARTVLGRMTPFVGRDVEIETLEAALEDCIGEPRARAIVVSSPPGVGKSRLAYELLGRIARFGADGIQIWTGRGDPMSAGSPFGLVAQAIRSTTGIVEDEPLATRHAKLSSHIARRVAARDAARVTAFLGELVGAHFSDADDVQLRAARQDRMLMGDQMRRAFGDLLRAECAHGPVVLVLEDLHWGDLPSVTCIDGTLRALSDAPFFVLALGRPEVHEVFPALWQRRAVMHLQLSELPRRASEELVRHVLEDVGAEVVDRLVERAAGNPLYLEELLRARVEGKGDELPETVLAMVQARLESLEPHTRLALRGASVFGQTFSRRGLEAMLGASSHGDRLSTSLEELLQRELICASSDARSGRDPEYVFRHAVLREAAYAALTGDDRKAGHAIAASWLEQAGKGEAVVLAEHLVRAGRPERAIDRYQKGAEQALEGNDLDAAIERAERGVALGAEGASLGALRLIQAEAQGWKGAVALSEECALEAMTHALPGSDPWCRAAAQAAIASGKLGHEQTLISVGRSLLAECATPPVLPLRFVPAIAPVAQWLLHMGSYQLAQALLDALPQPSAIAEPAVAAKIYQALAAKANVDGDVGLAAELTEAVASMLERAGNLRTSCNARAKLGYAYAELGQYPRAEATLRAAKARAEELGLPTVVAWTNQNLGMVLARSRGLRAAAAVERAALEAFRAQGDRRMEGGSRMYLALILEGEGRLAEAEEEARHAVEVLSAVRPVRCYALGVLSRVALAAGHVDVAAQAAEEASAMLDELGTIDAGEALVRLCRVAALEAAGDYARARRAVAVARDRLLARASRITDPTWRKSFLENVPENAETLAVARRMVADGRAGGLEP